MTNLLVFLFVFTLFTPSYGQIDTGGASVPYELDQTAQKAYRKVVEDLVKAFKDSWKRSKHSKAPFNNLIELNSVLILEPPRNPSDSTCDCNRLFSDKVKKALATFNNSMMMEPFLVSEFEITQEEAKNIVKAFKSYE